MNNVNFNQSQYNYPPLHFENQEETIVIVCPHHGEHHPPQPYEYELTVYDNTEAVIEIRCQNPDHT